MDELSKKIDEIETWLNNNIQHQRYEEGFYKFRKMLLEYSIMYIDNSKPKQQRLF